MPMPRHGGDVIWLDIWLDIWHAVRYTEVVGVA
jgi:hypothetical protein